MPINKGLQKYAIFSFYSFLFHFISVNLLIRALNSSLSPDKNDYNTGYKRCYKENSDPVC